ncbi:hypothetical protein [Aliikangiella sp. G2MR2-5]|uniref:hypothetical protein n=1 Tax=Aliikangiella sp. G2MR2-5 TaxID=2788943 RepID=UPI0018A9E8D3|nr:hypothetical protein [Aliikangiella sp. G2MR2-5]
MTIKHNWRTSRLLHTCYSGDVSGQELIEEAQRVGEDRRFENVRYVIGDWSQIDSAEINADDVKELAAYIRALAISFPGRMNASIVSDYESGTARATLYDILLEDTSWQTRTFSTFEQAMEWFGIELIDQSKG